MAEPSPTDAARDFALGSRYLRLDPAGHRAYVQLVLTNVDPAPLVLTGSRATDSPVRMQLRLVDPNTAALDLMAPIGGVFDARLSTSRVTLLPGAQAALEIFLEPDCARAPYATYPQLSIGYASGGSARTFEVPPELPIVTNWFDDAIAEACGGVPMPNRLVATRELDGLRITTNGPRSPIGPFVVQVTATNVAKTAFVGSVGVVLFDRAPYIAGGAQPEIGLNLVQRAFDPTLMTWSVAGGVVGNVMPIGSGALREQVRLAPGATGRFDFEFSLTSAPDVIGPLVGWIPAVMPGGGPFPDYADPGTFPQIVRPPAG